MKHNNIGVYYDLNDYAGFFRRFACLLIDAGFIGLIYIIFVSLMPSSESPNIQFALLDLLWLIFAFIYYTILKASAIKTLGYRLMGIKIVTLKGRAPNFLTMLYRLSRSLLGPFQLPFDILWLTNDENRQTLRDKCVGTYVIKENAVPVGTGVIAAVNYLVLGFDLLFKAVKRNG